MAKILVCSMWENSDSLSNMGEISKSIQQQRQRNFEKPIGEEISIAKGRARREIRNPTDLESKECNISVMFWLYKKGNPFGLGHFLKKNSRKLSSLFIFSHSHLLLSNSVLLLISILIRAPQRKTPFLESTLPNDHGRAESRFRSVARSPLFRPKE